MEAAVEGEKMKQGRRMNRGTGWLAVVLAALAACRAPVRSVTPETKTQFLLKLRTAPTQGEFLTEEGVNQLEPYISVLFALEADEVTYENFYPLGALSYGLCQREPGWRYAIRHFEEIRSPLLKTAWAALLFKSGHATPDVVEYLQQVLDTPNLRNDLEPLIGPDFPAFERRVRAASRR